MEISDAKMRAIIDAAVDQAIDKLLKEQKKQEAEKRGRKNEIRILKKKLGCYRSHVRLIQDGRTLTDLEKHEYRFQFLEDLMGITAGDDITENLLLDRDERLRRIEYEVSVIDTAYRLLEDAAAVSDNQKLLDSVSVLHTYYMEESPRSMEDIAADYCITERSAWRYLDNACFEMLKYIV